MENKECANKKFRPESLHGFNFTEADEICMRNAIRESEKDMEVYGQIPAPPQIDLSHYFPGIKKKK